MAERVARTGAADTSCSSTTSRPTSGSSRCSSSAGVPEARIAVLNATHREGRADRQRIAREFNGNPEDGEAPKYDVVIANAIAYEGIDLQTRTCAIHHLDLPWEPATLQQRNGRGVRQGNTLGAIEINYYFARRSQDGLRFNLIQGKLGWMTELLRSPEAGHQQPRRPDGDGARGHPAADLPRPREDRPAARRGEGEARGRGGAKKVASDACTAAAVQSTPASARRERAKDPTEAARLRLEAEERLGPERDGPRGLALGEVGRTSCGPSRCS